jgi:hypothetical protein
MLGSTAGEVLDLRILGQVMEVIGLHLPTLTTLMQGRDKS